MKNIIRGSVLASFVLLLLSACGGDDGEDTTCSCSCTCAGGSPTTLGSKSADACQTDCKASCTGDWEGQYECK
ncbi:MAG: hypothetical protein HS104_17390 [Polyangiaceae bacterium]|nr:hypothetical protein [Polyangiaceae bacterium]MCL4752144.1 hypothetical protein [Myxococcales bacterium]